MASRRRQFLIRLRYLLFGPSSAGPTGPPPTVPDDDLADDERDETVAAMLENLRVLVAFEEQKASDLAARGIGLAGFAGLTVAVLSATGDSSYAAASVLSAAAVILLVLTVAAIVLGLLTSREGSIQSVRQVALYREPEFRRLSPGRVQVQAIDSLVRRLDRLREGNRARSAWLNRSALALVLAVACAAAAAVVEFLA